MLVLIVWAAGKISRHDSWTLLAVGAGGLALAYAIGAKARTELRRHASDWWHKQLKQAIATTPAQQAATGLPVEPPPPPAA